METTNILEKLNKKTQSLMDGYSDIKKENEELRNELIKSQAQNEAKDKRISDLEDDISMKELELEEIVGKIENILG